MPEEFGHSKEEVGYHVDSIVSILEEGVPCSC
jgi:hypothetical protein